jgi:predicted RND superfamily exporter protein
LARLEAWIEALPPGDERYRLERDLADPTRAFMIDADGEKVRKFFKYELQDDGTLADLATGTPSPAPGDFQPQTLSDYEFHFAGMPRFERNFMVVGMEDMKIVGFMFLMIAFVLVVIFRSFVGLSLPLLIVFSSVMGMIGSVWVMGDLLNNLTAIAPNMVTAIGIADAIHLVAAYFALRPGHSNRRDLIEDVVSRNALPVFLTSITTAVGFFSLTVSDIVPMRMLGYTGGIGTLLAYALSMAVIPALLSLLPLTGERTQAPAPPAPTNPAGSGVWSDPLVAWVLRFRTPLVAVSAVLIVLSIVGLARVQIDTDFRAMFPDDNKVMVDFRWIENRLGGAGDLELVFFGAPFDSAPDADDERDRRLDTLRSKQLLATDAAVPGPPLTGAEEAELAQLTAAEHEFQRRRIAVSADFLQRVERLEQRLKREMKESSSPLRVLTKIDSALDVLRKISQVQHKNQAEYYRVPKAADIPDAARVAGIEFDEITEETIYTPAQDAASLAAQYYLQYENGAKPAENLSTLITADRRGFRMQARLRQASSALQQEAFARVRTIAREEFPELAGTDEEVADGNAISTMTLTGKLFLFAGMSQRFTYSFLESISLALVVITILIGLIFRSVGLAFLSLIPNVLPLVLPLGVLGLLGIALDGPAVIVVSVALGICVDDTIHFFTKFTRARHRGADVQTAFREVGAALTYTTILLILGFAVLATSQFTPNKMMGQLAVIMIALAWVADFVLTPALLSFFSRDKVTASETVGKSTADAPVPPQYGATR